MSHKNIEHSKKIKEAIRKSHTLSEEEKATSVKIVEEWVIEGKALGTLTQKLFNISTEMKFILAEIGVI